MTIRETKADRAANTTIIEKATRIVSMDSLISVKIRWKERRLRREQQVLKEQRNQEEKIRK